MSHYTLQYLKTDQKARYQGYMYYFKEGFCWTFILNENSEYQKTRLKLASVNDVNAMALYPCKYCQISTKYLVCLFNSFFIYSYKSKYINNTSSFQINDARQLPVIIPSKKELIMFEKLFDDAFEIKKNQYSNIITSDVAELKLLEIQEKIDNLVLKLYKII